MRVCIFGASGLVGRALIERLFARKDIEIRPTARTIGNSWALLRHNLSIILADLKNCNEVVEAVRGCTHVVNRVLEN